jgi:hypothetical protein
MRRPLLTIVVTSAFCFPVQAQGVPKDLVNLLMRGPGMSPNDNFDLRIGAPPAFPRELLPRGVTAAASTVSERMIVVVAEAPDLSGRDLSQHERDLTAAGWTNLSSMGMRGLVSSNMMQSSNLCKGEQYVTTTYSQRTGGGLNLRVAVTTDPRRGPCMPAGLRPSSYFADVDLPNLSPPERSRVMGSGSGSSNDRYDQNVRIETKLDAQAVVKHYGDQLEQAGWKRETRAGGPGAAFAHYTTVSTTKETVVAIIVAAALPGATQVAVNLQLLRVDPARSFPGRIGGAGMGGEVTVSGACCR